MIEKTKVLERLSYNDPQLCTNFGVDVPKPGSKDRFYVSLVVRPELIDTPITIILKKGIRAKEAKEALEYVATIIGDADKAASSAKAAKHVAKLGWFVRFGVHVGAVVTILFYLPGNILFWLKSHTPRL